MTDQTKYIQHMNASIVARYAGVQELEEEIEDNRCKDCNRWPCSCEDR